MFDAKSEFDVSFDVWSFDDGESGSFKWKNFEVILYTHFRLTGWHQWIDIKINKNILSTTFSLTLKLKELQCYAVGKIVPMCGVST